MLNLIKVKFKLNFIIFGRKLYQKMYTFEICKLDCTWIWGFAARHMFLLRFLPNLHECVHFPNSYFPSLIVCGSKIIL